EPGGDRRDDEREQRQRQETQSRLQRGVAEDVLHVERQEQEDRENPRRQAEGDDRDAGERRIAEQGHVEHRVPAMDLDQDERDQQRRGGGQAGDDDRAAPALRVAADQPEDEEEQGGREGDETGPVDRLGLGPPGLDELGLGDEDRRDPDRDVDEEDPLPAEAVGDDSADERADRDRAADRGPPDADSGRALATLELLRDQGQRGREHRRSAGALQAAREVEDGRVA